ncbi:chromate transporter [Orenia marismortui]|uniref:Chromate transporter n=1 Tax=Orenia marismortui TaxID=46469 RepID=A0A4V3GYG4_9FIRM|nr:chromate transporter [Orenia marismortui]TDX52364.1 chromate transporter [Orenia marismortui]
MVLINLFFIFFKIGLFTFGGGYAMLPLIQEEMIAHGWLNIDQFVDIVAVSQMTPGAIAINTATFVGYKVGGIIGALCSTFGVISPSLFIITIVATAMNKFKDYPLVEGAWQGIRPAVVGLIMAAVISIAQEVILDINGVVIGVVALILLVKLKLHPIAVIIISALLGLILGLL